MGAPIELELRSVEVLMRLALAGELRDDETLIHARRIGRASALIASGLGLGERDSWRIEHAALFHDIGKIAIPDSVLLKPGPLTPEELRLVHCHAAVGAELLRGTSSALLDVAAEIAVSHHERWDGGGYPLGLSGEAIPLAGRIVAVADVFDALTHQRPYKPAWRVDVALLEIEAGAGTQFDPRVVAAFRTLDHQALVDCGEGPIAQRASASP